MSDWQQLLTTTFPEIKFQFDYPLSEYSYFKVGGPAEMFVQITDKQQIAAVVKFCHQHDIKLTVLGSASNVVISDQGVSGLILVPAGKDFSVAAQDQKQIVVQAESGLETSKLVRRSAKVGASGLEPFIGVPGTVGGAVYNNAHYHQKLIGNVVSRVEVVNPEGEIYWLKQDQCRFDYEQSRFQQTDEVILTAEFKLEPGDKAEIKRRIKQSMRYRIKTQPLNKPSSGCIFKNVPNNPRLIQQFPQFADQEYVPAGFLIDQAGLKGKSEGDIEVSSKHAAFLVNNGSGTAQQIKQLINHVQQTIQDKFGVVLETEVFFIE